MNVGALSTLARRFLQSSSMRARKWGEEEAKWHSLVALRGSIGHLAGCGAAPFVLGDFSVASTHSKPQCSGAVARLRHGAMCGNAALPWNSAACLSLTREEAEAPPHAASAAAVVATDADCHHCVAATAPTAQARRAGHGLQEL